MTKRRNLDDEAEFDSRDNLSPLEELKEIKNDYELNDLGHRESRWRLIKRATISYDRMKDDQDEIDRFVSDDFWEEKPYKPKSNQLLLRVMQYMVGAPSTQSKKYKTAWDYATAVEILLGAAWRPDEIFAELKRQGGPYAVIKREGPDKSDFVLRPIDEDGSSTLEGANDGNDGNHEPRASARTGPMDSSVAGELGNSRGSQSNGSTRTAENGVKSPRMFDASKHIALTGRAYQNKILNLRIYDRCWVLIERVEDEGKILRFDAIGMELPNNDEGWRSS